MLFTILNKINFKGKLVVTNYKGKTFHFGNGSDLVKIRLTNKSIENKLFRNPSLYLGEGYMNKEIVIEEGTLDDFLKIITASYNDYMSNNFVFKMYESISTFFKSFQQINKLVKSNTIMFQANKKIL